MATNNRDVRMTLSVETLGAEDIKKLQSSVLALAKEAGAAAPEFERLANEIGQLGEQANALSNFESLGEKIRELQQRQEGAATSSEELRQKLTAAAQAAEQAAQRQKTAADTYSKARADLAALSGELTILRNSYTESGERVANYKQELERLTRAKVEQKQIVDQAREALRQENSVLAESERSQQKLQTQYDRSVKSLERIETALSNQVGEYERAAKAVDELGLASDDVAASQTRLIAALNQTGQAAQQISNQTRQARESLAAYEASVRSVAEATERETAAQKKLLEQFEEARSIVAAAEYVRFWEQALRDQEVAQQRAADELREYEAAIKSAGEAAKAQAAETEKFFEKFDEARRIVKAGEYVRFWEESLQQAEAAQRAATEAVQRLNAAFDAINTRNVQDVQRELQEVRNAMELIRSQSGLTGSALTQALQAGEVRAQALQREIRELTGELTLADRATALFRNSMGQIAAGNLIADGIGALVEKVKEMGRAFVTTQVQLETLRRGLAQIYGSTETAARQIEFLRTTAINAGISIGGISDSFVKFSAATKSSNIPLEQTNALFEAVTRAGTTLGLSSERVTLALDALGQIASKGVVSMEELRQQLGDSLPGALSITAKGLGVTDAQLVKLVESGQLAARDFFPALTKGLKDLQGTTDGLQATWERLKTTLTITAQNAGDAGWTVLLGGALKVLGGTVSVLGIGLQALSEALFTAGRAALVLIETLRGNGQQAMEFFSQEVDKSIERLERQAQAFNAMLDPSQAAAANTTAAAQANTQLGSSTAAAVQGLTAQQSAMVQAAATSQNFVASQQAAESVTKIMGDTALDTGAKWVQLGVQLGETIKKQEEGVVVAGKLAKAAEEQGKAIERVAQLRGDEQGILDANVQSSSLVLAALQKEANERESLAGTLRLQLEKQKELAIAETGSLEARKQQIEATEKKLAQAAAEAEASRQAVNNARAEADARRVAAETYRDNSGRIAEFTAALRQANAELDLARMQFAQGAISADQLAQAESRAAQATALYRDAQRDLLTTLDQVSRLKQAEIAVSRANLESKLAEARASEQYARLMNDEIGVSRALAQQKDIEIQLARLNRDAKIAEAQSAIEIINKKVEEEERSGTLTEQKKREYDIRILNEKAKLAEAKAGDSVIRSLEQERNAIMSRNSAASSSSPSRSSSSGSNMSGIGGSNSSSGSQQDPYGRSQYQQDFLRQQGGPVDASYQFDVKRRLESGGSFTAAELPALQNLLRVSQDNARLGAPGSVSLEGVRDNEMWVNIARRAVEQAQAAKEEEERQKQQQQVGSTTSAQPSVGFNQTRQININLGGRSQTVNVASEQDAAALESVFRQLESGAATSR